MPFKTKHPLYPIWHSMKERCRNKNLSCWNNYGGRGITVCSRWTKPNGVGFSNFLADMGERPNGYTLDRINNDGNYTPGNCRWATRSEQMRNQRVTRKVVIDGKTYIACDLAEIAGLKTDSIIERVRRGLPLQAVLSKVKLHDLSGLSLGGEASGKVQKAKTHCPKGHPYDNSNTSKRANGWRGCKICQADQQRAYTLRRKAA